MAQILTYGRHGYAVAEHASMKPAGLGDVSAGPKMSAAARRSRLSFRVVNLPAHPGYDPGLQRHHLLPRQLLSKGCFDALFARIGQDRLPFDDFRSNGLLLPANDAAALRIGLPMHRGPHREYNAMVIERVGQMEGCWARARLSSPWVALSDAVAGLRSLQRSLRRRLLDPGARRMALNRFDPLGHGMDFTDIDTMVDALWPETEPCGTEIRMVARPIAAVVAAQAKPPASLAPRLVWAS